MKLFKLIILISIIIGNLNCKKENVIIDIPSFSPEEETFFRFVNKVYKVDGKFYISACSRFINGFEEFGMEKEIKLNDTISFISGRQANVKYIVNELNTDSIELLRQSSSTGCLIMPGEEKPRTFKSDFKKIKIKCYEERDIISYAFIDNKKVNAKTAKEHLSKGNIFLLKTKANNDLTFGKQYERDECLKSISKEFGFEYYPISFCTPNDEIIQQIKEYNSIIFEYLKKYKKLKFENFFQLEIEFRNQLNICRSK